MQELIDEIGKSVSLGGCAFCAVELQEYAINGVTYGWRKGSHLKFALDFDDLGPLRSVDVREAVVTALKEISDCCEITHELVASALNANLVVKLARLDGAMGVLADCQIPAPGSTPDSTQLTMRIDTGERWALSVNPTGDQIDFYRVFLHEALHGHGLGHKPASIRDPALIAPMYSPSIRNLQPADKGELLRRYGPAKATPAQIPQGPSRAVQGEIKIVIDGQVWGASGPLKQLPQSFVFPPLTAPEELDDNDPTDVLEES